MKKTIFITIFAILISGCTGGHLLQNSYQLKNKEKQIAHSTPKVYHNVSFEYKIAPHDRIAVSVYMHPELSSKAALIDSRGNAMLPLVNSIHLAGLTQPQAARKLQSAYGRYLKRSSVQLEVINKKAFVVGEVGSPGPIALPNEEMPLLQAIASARGFRDTSNRGKIVVIRKSGQNSKVNIVDLTNITSLSYANMMIRPGDVVYVTPNTLKDINLNIMPIFKIASTSLSTFLYFKNNL